MNKSLALQSSPVERSRNTAVELLWTLIFSRGDNAAKWTRTQEDIYTWTDMKIGNDVMYKIVKSGIPSKAIDPAGYVLGLSKSVMAHYIDLDRGTVSRLAAKDQDLPTHAAESILRMLELNGLAAETFETEEEASAWLNRPHPMLDGEAPLAAAKTSFGAQRVKDILVAIKYGGAV